MKIIKQASRGITVSYCHEFGQADTDGRVRLCAGFDCKAPNIAGTAKAEYLPLEFPAARDNLARCLAGLDGIVSMGIARREHAWYEPAIGECGNCREHVQLDGFTNTCTCGADYNQSGQRLADRSQWGEETGETADDILRGEFDWD